MSIHELFQDRSERVDNVEIMNTYGNSLNMAFTEQDLHDFEETFQTHKAEYRPNLKVDHSTHQSLVKKLLGIDKPDTELPNLGYFDNFRTVGASLFADIVEIPKKIKDLVLSGQFKGVSPELYLDYRGTGKKFIESVVLTNHPRFKHQLNLSELDGALGFSGKIHIKDEVVNMSDIDKKEEKAVTAEGLEQFEKTLTQKFSDLFRGKDKADSVSAENTALSDMQTRVSQLEDALEIKATELKKFSDAFTVLSTKSRHDSSNAICERAIAQGVKPAIVEHFRPLLSSSLSDQKIKFSDIEGKEHEKSVFGVVEDFFNSQTGQIDFSDRTFTSVEAPGSPTLVDQQSEMEEKGLKYFSELKSQGLSEHEAMVQAIEKLSEA